LRYPKGNRGVEPNLESLAKRQRQRRFLTKHGPQAMLWAIRIMKLVARVKTNSQILTKDPLGIHQSIIFVKPAQYPSAPRLLLTLWEWGFQTVIVNSIVDRKYLVVGGVDNLAFYPFLPLNEMPSFPPIEDFNSISSVLVKYRE